MKVLISHTRYDGSQYYRSTEPARAVNEADLGITVEPRLGLATTMYPDPDGEGLVVGEVDARGADVVVLQLPKTVESLQMIRVLQAQGVAVVVEMDDLASGVPYGHQGHDVLVRHGVARWARLCALEADFVTVSTPYLLKEYAPHGRGMVVPNAIPRRNAELPPAYEREPDTVTIGWTGNVFVHPYDLQEMGSGLQQALDRTRGRSRFVILGQKHDVVSRLRLPDEPEEIPWIPDVDEYVAGIGQHFDIGIAPLRIDAFNTAKSWLKPLEYAARGVASVRATTDEYERLGLGWRARSPKDWARGITALVEDADRRRELAAAARQKVLAGHLTEHTAELWATAWRRARDNRTRNQRKGA
jgi:glycosyltransferase involved in cell wall biosynthesis